MPADGYVTDVAYIPGFYANLAPTLMRYAASVNRIVPPATANGFRYLELGCGLGRSTTLLAAANPEGEFIGVDINPEHTKAATADIDAGRLENCRVLTADFSELPDSLGTFDFIAAHGVFSWVAPQTRETLLRVFQRHLAPGGLLLISYNAMPGWAHLQPIRGILRQYALLKSGDSVERIRSSLAYLTFLRDNNARYFEDNPRAAAYVDGILRHDPRYVVHEYLNEHWTSFYFAEVADMLSAAGLSFCGTLPIFTNFWDLCVRPEFQQLFRTTTNRLITEAHKDFCANTSFRWDLYTKQPRGISGVFERASAISDVAYRVAQSGVTLPYQANLGVVTSTIQGPLYATLVEILSSESLTMPQLLAHGRLAEAVPDEAVKALDAGVAMGLFEISRQPIPPQVPDLSSGITIPLPYNRSMLSSEALGGRPVSLASTRGGTGFSIGDFDAAILDEFVNGGRRGLRERVEARLSSSGRTLQQQGRSLTEPTERTAAVELACDAFLSKSLPHLARLGIVDVR